jgi:magnesium transporter
MSGIVNCVAYSAGRRVGDVAIEQISTILQQTDGFIWIGLHEPKEALLRQVQQAFELHDLAIEDAHRAHQRPKLERYGDCLFVVLHTAELERDRLRLQFGETHLFVGPRYIVSVRHRSSLSYAEVRQRCETTPPLLGQGPGFVLYALMDFIVDQYFPVVDALEDALEALEAEIFGEALSRETTQRIYQLKRQLLDIKRAVAPLVEVCNRLMRFDLALIPEDTRPYFRDIYDHVIRINDMVDVQRELLTTALEANLSLIAVEQNEVVKRLAGLAVLIAVPTLIVGVYGMNFEFMPELRWPYGYPLVMGAMLGLCGLLYVYFKRLGWF